MTLLTIILFKDSIEFSALSGKICEKVSSPDEKEFCGCWDILFNRDECIASISEAVNHFLGLPEKREVIFGCCMKDYNDIMQRINTSECEINCISADVFVI